MKTLSIRGETTRYRAVLSSVMVFFGAFFLTYFVASMNNPVGESYADSLEYVESLPPALSISLDARDGAASAARNLELEEAPVVSSEVRNSSIVYTVFYAR